MNAKWYFGALIIIFTFFGASQDSLMVPNQEIVLEFSNTEVSVNDTTLAIANVKTQLERIGASQVEVRNKTNGRFVISYYSATTVATIKDVLSTTSLAVDYASRSNNPEYPTQPTYNLDVFEILKSSDSGFGSSGKHLLEFKQDYDRFSKPNVDFKVIESNAVEKHFEIAVAYKLNKTIAIAINTIPHKIPEGRAGPLS